MKLIPIIFSSYIVIGCIKWQYMLEQVAYSGWGVYIFEDIQNPRGQCPMLWGQGDGLDGLHRSLSVSTIQ